MLFTRIKKWRSEVLVYLTHQMALPILRFIRKPEIFPYTIVELNKFPQGTLGKDLALFLENKGLELLPYYARHDMKHILLGYDTTDEGEGCLQCFMLGNGHKSFPVLATVLYGLITMPEHWSSFRKAFTRGRKTGPIAKWKWFELLEQPTGYLKQRINTPRHLPIN